MYISRVNFLFTSLNKARTKYQLMLDPRCLVTLKMLKSATIIQLSNENVLERA